MPGMQVQGQGRGRIVEEGIGNVPGFRLGRSWRVLLDYDVGVHVVGELELVLQQLGNWDLL